MSFILDALRKSEHERQRSTVPGLAHVPLATAPQPLPRWAVAAIAALGIAVLVLAGAWWQSTRSDTGTAASRIEPSLQRTVALPPPAASPSVTPAPVATAVERALRSVIDGLSRSPKDTKTTSYFFGHGILRAFRLLRGFVISRSIDCG